MMNEKLASVFRYYPARWIKAERPWRMGEWLWATQGHLLVAIADDGSDADETPENMRKADRYVTVPSADVLNPVSLSELRKFAGSVIPEKVPCERCFGSGRSDFDGDEATCEHCGLATRAYCTECGGDGHRAMVRRYGKVNGVPVDLALLAFGLSIVPQDEAGSISFLVSVADEKQSAVAVTGEGWRVVLMRLSKGRDGDPEFHCGQPESADAVGQ